jgi:uncharacterized membrane protein YphA (DoxX/SURF4 family)
MNQWTKACLIALRLAIGWHFLYEGVWKIASDKGTVSYATSWYVLQPSLARLREYFRQPGDVQLEPALARVDTWYDDIVRAFKGKNMSPDEGQKARLAELRDKIKLAAYEASRGAIRADEVVNFEWTYLRDDVLKIPPLAESERFTSLAYLQSSAGPLRPVFRGLARDMDGFARLTPAAAQAAIDNRYNQIVDHYASADRPFTADQLTRFGKARDALKIEIAAMMNAPDFRDRLQDYRIMRERSGRDASSTDAPFSRERLDSDRTKLDAISGELLAFVNEPLTELAVQAEIVATVDQLSAGPPPRPGDPAVWVDRTISWGLTAIGLCLLLGLFTPYAALAAAGQLAVFYFASPAWPGLPAAALGGHYLYIDRNVIELIAACVVATSATGKWAGLDYYLDRFLFKRKPSCDAKPAPAVEAPVHS